MSCFEDEKISTIADFFGLTLNCPVPRQSLVLTLHGLSCYARHKKKLPLCYFVLVAPGSYLVLCKMVPRSRRRRRMPALSTATSSQSRD